MIHIAYLNKQEKETWLPRMFALFHENMNQFLQDHRPYEMQLASWIREILPALDKDPRQVVLCLEGDILVGFLMYYTRHELLMVEEVQIQKAYQRTSLFHSICKFLRRNLPSNIQYIEAFAHKSNHYSQYLMQKIGMESIEDCQLAGLVHMRGRLQCTGYYIR